VICKSFIITLQFKVTHSATSWKQHGIAEFLEVIGMRQALWVSFRSDGRLFNIHEAKTENYYWSPNMLVEGGTHYCLRIVMDLTTVGLHVNECLHLIWFTHLYESIWDMTVRLMFIFQLIYSYKSIRDLIVRHL